MYYNKELYLNEEIRAREKRLCKLQTVLVLSISGALIVAFLACTIPLTVVCNLLVVMRNGKEKQIKAMEAEIAQELLQEPQRNELS